jgi:4-hydroxythreonine-4-phosphate dehydrogenase
MNTAPRSLPVPAASASGASASGASAPGIRPRIAVTVGDPAGIGPEVCLKLLAQPAVLEMCQPILFGEWAVLERVARHCGLPLAVPRISVADWPAALERITGPAVLDLPSLDAAQVVPGVVSAATGAASYAYIDRAINEALAGRVDAITTGPIHKEALRAAGIPFPGHTEIFAARTAAERSCMMLTSESITCSFVTAHVGYRDVPGLLSVERILDVIELTAEALERIRGRPPRLLVCGLNPHAGEHGLFGDREEERFIEPAVREAQRRGRLIEGPLPPDTVFLPARRQSTDGFICMYHDQGHIPLKALAFDLAVNITLGLPILRTSVDHGTACDIAWRGKADVSSLVQAVQLATRLTRRNPASP